MESRSIRPVNRPLSGAVRVPGSKSITNRALVLASLSHGQTTLTGALFSDDTARMCECLTALGFVISADPVSEKIVVLGMSGEIPATEATLFVGNSGTTARFITPTAALGKGTFVVDGVARMRERPIQDLAEALRSLGVSVDCPTGCPPLTILARGLQGGETIIRADASSQFLSGILLASPCADAETTITVDGPFLSAPYVTLTVEMVRQFGGVIEVADEARTYRIAGNQVLNPLDGTYAIEPDASSASYFWAAAAITGGTITARGIGPDSLQGDAKFVDALARMGCVVEKSQNSITVSGAPNGLRGINIDMNEISDTVMTLAAVAVFAEGPTQIENIGHIRHKETDRLSATANELQKLGATVEEGPDFLVIYPPRIISPARIFTYDDHRMAMAFSLVGLMADGIEILDPGCVAKTFPDYFSRLEALCDANRD